MELQNDQLRTLIRQSVEGIFIKNLGADPDCFQNIQNKKGKKLWIAVPDCLTQRHGQLEEIIKKYSDYYIIICSDDGLELDFDKNIPLLSLQSKQVRKFILSQFSTNDIFYAFPSGLKQLNDIVNLNEEDFVSCAILNTLLRNGKVVVHFDYNPYGVTSGTLSEKVSNLLYSMEGLNIEVAYPGDSDAKKQEQRAICGLVTQQDVDEMWKAGKKEFYIDKKCMITPLAKDRIQELGIQTVFV